MNWILAITMTHVVASMFLKVIRKNTSMILLSINIEVYDLALCLFLIPTKNSLKYLCSCLSKNFLCFIHRYTENVRNAQHTKNMIRDKIREIILDGLFVLNSESS